MCLTEARMLADLQELINLEEIAKYTKTKDLEDLKNPEGTIMVASGLLSKARQEVLVCIVGFVLYFRLLIQKLLLFGCCVVI